jgi:transposase
MNNKNKNITDLQSRLQVLEQQMVVLNRKNDRLKVAYDEVKEEQGVLKNSHQALKKDHRILVKDHQVLEKKYKILEKENLGLKEENESLKGRLSLNSSNSSKPPSSDGLAKPCANVVPQTMSLREKSQKPSGGQKGHKGAYLSQRENPDHIVLHGVDRCEHCGESLVDVAPSHIHRRQIFDLPEQALEVTEHQAEEKKCRCGKTSKGLFSKGVNAYTQYGKRIQAFGVYFQNDQFLPEDRTSRTFQDVFNVKISPYTLVGFTKKCAKNLQSTQENTLEEIKKEPVKGADETGFRVAGSLHWVQVLCSSTRTYLEIGKKRGIKRDDVEGILVHDNFKSYGDWAKIKAHALCNAHHRRELKFIIQTQQETWAQQADSLLCHALSISKMPESPQKRILQCLISKNYDQITKSGLEFHENQPPPNIGKRAKRKGHNLVLRFINKKEDILRFLFTPDVPFTNNQAERDLRMIKVKQKISGSFRTLKGAEDFLTIQTHISTQRKQDQNIFQSITHALNFSSA